MRVALLATIASLALGVAANQVHAVDIAALDGPVAPSFRGAANTTYFGWNYGTWDGNADAAAGEPAIPDTLNGVPSINPGSLPGTLLAQNNALDIVSGSNNIYTGPGNVNLTLTIPTSGVVGTGFTTIIVQGNSLGGFAPDNMLNLFDFGAIEGVSPTYVSGFNGQGPDASSPEAQWWAKWELPGNQSSYSVAVSGSPIGAGVLSVSDLSVDTLWSASDFAPDTARVPEPGSFALVGAALSAVAVAIRRRRA